MRFSIGEEGWGYAIYDHGKEEAFVYVDNKLLINTAIAWLKQQFPGPFDWHGDHTLLRHLTAMMATIEQSREYQADLSAQFARKHVASFARFDIALEVIAQLDALLVPDVPLAGVDTFRELLDIEGMYCMTYSRIQSNIYEGRDTAEPIR